MTKRRWPFAVDDALGRKHRGSVVYTDAALPDLDDVPPGHFQIVLLAAPSRVRSAPERTAICVPGVPRLRPLGAKIPSPSLPRKIADLWFPPRLMAAHAAGRIVTPARNITGTDEVFPKHSDRPRLDRLALAIVTANAIEMRAPYVALIRHHLKLPRGADALSALDARLSPDKPSSRPPRRAPALGRLKSVSRRLHAGLEPQTPLEQLADDLRFLALFDDTPMSRAALGRLLGDVRASVPKRRASRRQTRAALLPFGRRGNA